MQQSDDFSPQPPQPDGPQFEIPLGRTRRWGGLIAYAVFYVAVCGVLVWFLYYFTKSLKVAGALVLFMSAYMLIAGWLASRNTEGREGKGHDRG